MPVEISTGN